MACPGMWCTGPMNAGCLRLPLCTSFAPSCRTANHFSFHSMSFSTVHIPSFHLSVVLHTPLCFLPFTVNDIDTSFVLFVGFHLCCPPPPSLMNPLASSLGLPNLLILALFYSLPLLHYI
eukprot:EG_transcript_27219